MFNYFGKFNGWFDLRIERNNCLYTARDKQVVFQSIKVSKYQSIKVSKYKVSKCQTLSKLKVSRYQKVCKSNVNQSI